MFVILQLIWNIRPLYKSYLCYHIYIMHLDVKHFSSKFKQCDTLSWAFLCYVFYLKISPLQNRNRMVGADKISALMEIKEFHLFIVNVVIRFYTSCFHLIEIKGNSNKQLFPSTSSCFHDFVWCFAYQIVCYFCNLYICLSFTGKKIYAGIIKKISKKIATLKMVGYR